MGKQKDYLRGRTSLDLTQRNDSSDRSPDSKGSKINRNDRGVDF